MIPDLAILALMALGAVLVWRANKTWPQATVVLLCAALAGCGASMQAKILDTTGAGVNAALPILASQMEEEGLAKSRAAATRVEAEAALEDVRENWRPVWASVDAFEVAYDAAAALVKSGEELSLKHLRELLDLYCEVRRVVKPHEYDLPNPPLIGCEP